MLFTEGIFFLFCAVVLAVYWRTSSNQARKVVLLVASYVFYGFWDWRFLGLLALHTSVDFVIGLRLPRVEKRAALRLLTLSLVWNLGLLGFFKYYNFFADSLSDLFAKLGSHLDVATLHVVLPVGISFYTFQSLSYTIDVYRKDLKPCPSFLDYATFMAFFPQLVAGPIVRASQFLKQLDVKKTSQDVDLVWALSLFLVGFFKKACVADNLSPLADAFFGNSTQYGAADAWIGTLAYAVQIYCDFSGYSDMAIAVAGLFGYTLRSNFDAPYLASDLTDFWRRWHMSLSSWLRDYLYIPLGGGRGGVIATYRNLMATMVLGGLWHGAAWKFVLWGGMHGAGLLVHKEWQRRAPFSLPWMTAWFLTGTWVALAWIPFRARGIKETLGAIRALLGGGSGSARLSTDGGLSWAIVLVLLFIAHVGMRMTGRSVSRSVSLWQWGLGCGVCWALVLAARRIGYVPFVYFQF